MDIEPGALDLLQARALRLAQVPADAAPQEQWEVIEFVLGRERYAVEASCVREVAVLPELTRLPCVPPHVLGVINLRGEVLAVVDIKRFFGLPQEGISNLNRVLVLRCPGMVFGVLADEVLGVRQLAVRALQPVQDVLAGVPASYLKGVTAERLIVVDGLALLRDPALIVNQEG